MAAGSWVGALKRDTTGALLQTVSSWRLEYPVLILAKYTKRGQGKLTVAASNDNVKLLAVLAIVDSRVCRDRVSKESALEVGLGFRIRAGGGRGDCGITLVVNVEAKAELLAITEVGACLDIVVGTINVLVGQVTNLLGGFVKALESLDVAAGSSYCQSLALEQACGILVLVGFNRATGGNRCTTASIVSWLDWR